MTDRSWLMGMREEEQNSSQVLRTLVILAFFASKVQTPPLREKDSQPGSRPHGNHGISIFLILFILSSRYVISSPVPDARGSGVVRCVCGLQGLSNWLAVDTSNSQLAVMGKLGSHKAVELWSFAMSVG